ncbi:MAG: ATPase, T2SS/T4P/T4SS family [Mycobacteriales bacterium]
MAADVGPDPELVDDLSILTNSHSIPLGELLVRQGALSSGHLAEALLQQKASDKMLGTLLIEMGIIEERQLTAGLSVQLNIPLVDLRRVTPEPAAAALLAESQARELGVIPISVSDDDVLDVAIGEPTEECVAQVYRALLRPVRILLASPTEIRRAIDSTYRALSGVEQQIAAFTAVQGEHRGGNAASQAALPVGGHDAPVVQVVNMLITQALRDRASDVHIEPQDERVRVRFRIDGALHDVLALPGSMASAIASRIKIMGSMNIVERRRPQDGQIALTLDGRAIDIRVATTGTIWGEKVVLRLLDKSRPLYKLQDLGMPAETHDNYAKIIRSPYGMVICAGPTGSGKTTTLYASMTEVNGPERNITTIEDPVEYVFPSINQIQINEAAGITFAGGLRSILRQDPDMILVGEIRDAETARIAVQSALTGHFVLSSLHATDAVSALYRFLDMGIESFLVASSVIAVVGQRLVRRTCNDCKVRFTPSAQEIAFFEQAGGRDKSEFWIGEGCNFCSRTGYSDRVGVYEVLQITEEMRELIVAESPSHHEMRRLAIAQGMQPLRKEAVRLVSEDVTTIAEIVRSIYTV